MKALFLHCDYIKFKPLKKALKNIKDISEEERKEKKIEEALAVFLAIEKNDGNKNVIKELVKNVEEVSKQIKLGVKAKGNVVLYPYAHLSSNLASPELAVNTLLEAEKALKNKFNVIRAPFGYYKEFEIKVKGHPLSELSREIKVEKEKEESYDTKQLLCEVSKTKLDKTKLKENDHRILGMKMDLFSFSEVAPGMVFWHNNGLVIRNELINFWREIHKKEGYEEVLTPQILDKKLWQISGHWEKYKENIFLTEYEKRIFAVKPMNCPGGILIFKNKPKSYKDLPLRMGELGIVHRQELSGVLGGLFRVIQFTQDDAHIFCTEEQMTEELVKIVEMAHFFYKKFNLEVDHVELSTRPKKRIGTNNQWDIAELTLEKVLKKLKVNYKINKGEGAFYGPKIDFHVKDSLGRTWQCATVQLDFSMPERFELEYTDKDNKKKTPVMIHRTIYGSLERFIAILLEHTNGRLPTWLSPIQVRVLSFTDRNISYAKKITKKLEKEIPNLRIDLDFSQTSLSLKVREAEIMRIPYIIVVGDKEEKDKKLAVRIKGSNKIKKMSFEKFTKELKKEIAERK